MTQSLNLVQDLEFTESAELAVMVVGGLTMTPLPIWHRRWEDWFREPQPVHPPRPTHPPIFDFPRSHPGSIFESILPGQIEGFAAKAD